MVEGGRREGGLNYNNFYPTSTATYYLLFCNKVYTEIN